MPHLSLSVLGPFHATLDGEPITRFESNKVRALLVYLAVEAVRPHPREVLAGLLWPERPSSIALRNLRQALSNLREAIGDRPASPPFLLISRATLQFNAPGDCWLDVTAFRQQIAGEGHPPSAVHRLQSAISLYRGRFMEGFSVRDSAPFEEWLLFKREEVDRQVLSALQRLAVIHGQRGEYGPALGYVRRQIELEPWQEEAHQQLMRLLSLSGRRSEALAQYNICRRLLADELGVEPAAETTALYENIRAGVFSDRVTGPVAPHPLVSPSPPPPVSPAPFVARECELERLDRFLAEALDGQGRVVFVTGEAGTGKTALVNEFARRAMAAHGDVTVAIGSCDAYAGIGDPYLPFREIMQMLTGGIEAKRAGGAISPEHARCLWAVWPAAMQALVEAGPDLVDLFVTGSTLLTRTEAFARDSAGWSARLEELVERATAAQGPGLVKRVNLFEQVTAVLQAVARRHPLLLVVDDLQWADAGSISLLFHLGRRLAGHRLLVIGAYRPSDLALGRGGECHPLAPIVREFQRECGDIEVDLDQAESRAFVGAFLDSEPNRLGPAFRDTLYRHTGGQALFTVELVRGLRERGDLVRDEAGRWVEGPELDWERLPTRVEAVIAERIARLPREWQAMLTTASVEGDVFTAEVVAHVQDTDEREVIRCMSGALGRQHRLIRSDSVLRLDNGQRLSRYRFRHYLFQKYLYNRLDAVERAHRHEAVGNTLEALYGEQAAEIANQLARHFEAAGLAARAADYLLQAGKRAAQLSADAEAIALFSRGLALLQACPESAGRAERELARG